MGMGGGAAPQQPADGSNPGAAGGPSAAGQQATGAGSSGSSASIGVPDDGSVGAVPAGGNVPAGAGGGVPNAPAGDAAGGVPGPAVPQLPPIKFSLSNGIAKPENNGQATDCSVEYVLASGTIAADMKIVWVIHPAKGDDVVKPVTVRSKDKLRSFFKDLAADRGPFECYLAIVMADGSMQPVSEKAALK
jgi:hypothetical protein